MTKEELYSNLSKDMADYCIARMNPYTDPRTNQQVTGILLLEIYAQMIIYLQVQKPLYIFEKCT